MSQNNENSRDSFGGGLSISDRQEVNEDLFSISSDVDDDNENANSEHQSHTQRSSYRNVDSMYESRILYWETVPSDLSSVNYMVSLDTHHIPLFDIPPDKLYSMDGVSKCWKCIPPDSTKLLLEDTDGITWAICEECITQIPPEIQRALYFFHNLQQHVREYSMYSASTSNVVLQRNRHFTKNIPKVLYRRHKMVVPSNPSNAEMEIDMNAVLQERSSYNKGESITELSPLRIKLAFTGVTFKLDGEDHKKIYAVLFVTFAKNFAGLDYIQEVFLCKPHPGETNYKQKIILYKEWIMIWKRMLSFVAFKNLCLNEALHDKPDFSYDSAGVLGVDTLLNVFQIPNQIYYSIKRTMLGDDVFKPNSHLRISDVCIAGMPYLSFRQDVVMREYLNYMHIHISTMNSVRKQIRTIIDLTAAAEKKKAKGESKKASAEEMAEEEEAQEIDSDVFCVGLWPLEEQDGLIVKWGLPKLPIFLNFEPEFTTDINTTFDLWLCNAGGPNGIPELVNACLRSFLVSFGFEGAGGDEEQQTINWDSMMLNPQRANPSLVLQKYYSEESNPMESMVVSGYLRTWWQRLVRDFEVVRMVPLDSDKEPPSVTCIHQKMTRYLQSVILNHESSIHSNSYRSNRVSQAFQIVNKLDWKSAVTEGPDSICERMRSTRCKMAVQRQHDPYAVANEMFWRSWEELNRSFKMNTSNLSFLVEMMITQLFWMTGENTTWHAYFQGIQIKSGNGHYKVTTREGTVVDDRKPNSSGMDWSHARVSELYQNILDRVGITNKNDNLQTPVNVTGWTPASVPVLSHVTIRNNQILSAPDPQYTYRSIICTECRDSYMGALIGNFPRNPDSLNTVKLNTCDPNNTNERQTKIQILVAPLQICALSSNVLAKIDTTAEQYVTLSAVLHVMVPGSAPYMRKRKYGAFNNQTCNAFHGRKNKPENMDAIVNALVFPNIWASCMGALINKSAAIPWEMNPAVVSYLEWIFFFVREHAEGIIELFVNKSFKRMKDGYESRQVAKSIWTSAMRDLATTKNHHEALMKNLQCLHVNALPVQEVPAVVHSFLCRGINMGATLMVVVCGHHLEVPILPIDRLCNFFDNDTVDDEALTDYNRIRAWMTRSVHNHRFCVDDNGNKTLYMSSDSDENQGPKDEGLCLLRVRKPKTPHCDVNSLIGQNINKLYGKPLYEACHMGPESSIYANAIHSMLQEYAPDFRQLYSNFIYHSKRHVDKLKMNQFFPECADWAEDSPPPLAKIFANRDQNREIQGFSLGINVWGLLLMASLGATTMHPHVVSDIARNILKDILQKAPMCATPGNSCNVRSFHLETTLPQSIMVSNERRPKHFLRPLNDLSFLQNGEFTYAANVKQFMPEDILHCGFLFSLAKTLCCNFLEIPGSVVYADYEINANEVYAVWDCIGARYGTLKVVTRDRDVVLRNITDESEDHWRYEDWNTKLKQNNYVILPVISRAGACVWFSLGKLGLLVPCSDDSSNNLNEEDGSYMCIVEPDMVKHRMDGLEVLRNLVGVGTQFLLDIFEYGERYADLQQKIPRGRQGRTKLLVRLNVPSTLQPNPNKVFVSYVQKPSRGGSSDTGLSCSTLEVDVWELEAYDDSAVCLEYLWL